MRTLLLAAAAAVLACGPDAEPAVDTAHLVDAEVPPEHAAGRALFDAHCAPCHGPAGTGSEQGPPLVHIVYVPSHHGDMAFQVAVQRGVRAHHWRFGDMPPQPQVSAAQADSITGYIRWLQRRAGIE